MNLVISSEYVEKNYIHKDKVREKIKEIRFDIEVMFRKCETIPQKMWDKIEVLEELLEETEDENNNTTINKVEKEQSTDFNKQQNT